MKLTTRQRLLASTLLLGAATLASPAWAQAQDDSVEPPAEAVADPGAGAQDPGGQGITPPPGPVVSEIIVTGSRIPRPDLTSTSPLAVVQDEEFAYSGAVNVEQVINTLPQVVPGTSAYSNNPGGGVATLNLRGLGSQRNLVLVNGRRYIFFDTTQVTDLNTIPSFLLDSVDVVTGGASAVYGSDALAGVTNFRLRNDLDGLLLGGQTSITEEGDGLRYNAYAAIGTPIADGRGNITIFGEYYNRGSIYQADRPWSENALGDDPDTGTLVPGGSAGVPQGRFVAAETLAIGEGASCGGENQPPRNAGCFAIAEGTNYPGGGAFFGTPGTSTPYTSANAYNYAPSNYLMVPQERWSLGGYGEYEISPAVNAYAEVAYINNRVENELAATPITQNVDYNLDAVCEVVSAADCEQLQLIAERQQIAIAAAEEAGAPNPYGAFTAGSGSFGALQEGFVRLQTNTRTTQIANRISTDDRNAFRVLGGLRGPITNEINYDVYYMYSRTRNANIQQGNVSRSAFTRLGSDLTCNYFGLNQLSDECLEGLSILAQNQDVSTLQVAQGSVSGSLFQSPWAIDALGFAVGAEYRKMSAEFIPDTALSSGDVAGFNAGDPTAGSYDVQEIFGELRVPLIQESFIHSLEVNGAARWSEYSLDAVGGVPTYAIGAQLSPVRDITLRGQYQRAVRAPNVNELFGGQAVGFPPATDPCAQPSAATDATVRALCEATGVPASNVGQGFLQPNTQIEGVFGGNPDLEEEIGDTWTAGVVLQPSFIPRLNIAVDWYNIQVDNLIASAGGGVANILNLCYNVIQDASHPVCGAIIRDAQGSISGGGVYVVEAFNANLASFETEGVDLAVDYSMPMNFGLAGPASRLSFFFLGNYTRTNDFTPVVGVDDVTACAGRFGLACGNPTPEYKFTTRVAWQDGPLTSTLRWRHVGATTDDDDSYEYVVNEIDGYNLFDLAFSLSPTDAYTINFGINNLFDKRPPILGWNQTEANTYPEVFDVLGRDFFVSVNMRL